MRVFVFRQYSGKIFFVVAKILTSFVNITHFLCKINLLSISFTHFFHPSIYNIYISLKKFLYRDRLTKEVKAWRTGFKCLISHALNHGTQYPPGELSGLLTFKWDLYPERYSLSKRICIGCSLYPDRQVSIRSYSILLNPERSGQKWHVPYIVSNCRVENSLFRSPRSVLMKERIPNPAKLIDWNI